MELSSFLSDNEDKLTNDAASINMLSDISGRLLQLTFLIDSVKSFLKFTHGASQTGHGLSEHPSGARRVLSVSR